MLIPRVGTDLYVYGIMSNIVRPTPIAKALADAHGSKGFQFHNHQSQLGAEH